MADVAIPSIRNKNRTACRILAHERFDCYVNRQSAFAPKLPVTPKQPSARKLRRRFPSLAAFNLYFFRKEKYFGAQRKSICLPLHGVRQDFLSNIF